MQINNEKGIIERAIEKAIEKAIDIIKNIIKKEFGPDVPITNIKNVNQSGGTAEDPVIISDENVFIFIINI